MPGSVRTLCSLAAVISAMVEQKMPADRIGATAPPSEELAQQYWATMARTADLVRTLTALADRYDASGEDDDDARVADRHAAAAVMRTTAEAGRHLIRSLAPPAFPPPQQPPPSSPVEQADRACLRDVQAVGRDAAAEARDERAVKRDVRERAVTGDDDPGFAGRFLAACDRDDAAGDRAEAFADRRAAQTDRSVTASRHPLDGQGRADTHSLLTLLEERVAVRQAQGVLMDRAGMTAGEAFEALLLAATGPLTLDGVADHVLRRAELPTGQEREVI